MHCLGSHRKLNQFRYDERYLDISVRIQSTTMKCHKVILASVSEFFDVMFYSTFRENNEEEIVLDEIDPLAFECILDFAYLGKVPNFFKSGNNVYNVLKACDFLRVHDLVELCISHIINHTSSIENICEIYVFSCLSNYPTLSNALNSYIAENFYTVSQNQDFLILPYEQLYNIMEKYQSLNNNSRPLIFNVTDLLLDAIIRWILHILEERKIHFVDLVSIVNIGKISENYLKFLSNEYKMNLNGLNDLKSVETFLSSETEDALPVVVYEDPFKDFALHVFVQYTDYRWGYDYRPTVFSLSKYNSKCQWSTCELENWSFFYESMSVTCVQMVAFDEPYNSLYCLSRGRHSFLSYSTVSLNEEKTLKVPHLKISKFSTMTRFQNDNIYLYDDHASPQGEPRARNIVSVLNYKCDLDKWFDTVPKMKRNVSSAQLVSDHKLLYLIGLGSNISDAETYFPGYVQAYDYRVPKWEELTKFSTSKIFGQYRNLCCCCLNNVIYASDGRKIEVFDIVAGKWIVVSHNNYAPKDIPIMIHEILPYENHLWIFYSENKIWSSWRLIIFDPNAMIWLPCPSFLNAVETQEEKFEQKYFPSLNSNEGRRLHDCGEYGYDKIFLNAIVFKPLDANPKYV